MSDITRKAVRQEWVNMLSEAVYSHGLDQLDMIPGEERTAIVGYYVPETVREASGRVGARNKYRWLVQARSRYVLYIGLWAAIYDIVAGRVMPGLDCKNEFAAYVSDGYRFSLLSKTDGSIGDAYMADSVYLVARRAAP